MAKDRVFGCPSIRSDIPTVPISKRSLADSQNYGDDVPAQDLINPPAFSDLSIKPTAMSEYFDYSKIIELFGRIGYSFEDDVADQLFSRASFRCNGNGDVCTINAFRDTVNEYLLSLEYPSYSNSKK
eukprot:gene15416-20798_t